MKRYVPPELPVLLLSDPLPGNSLGRALYKAGIDRAVAYTLVSRGWTLLSGVVSLALLTRYLTPVQQGFYYTFINILAIQVFFELGLSTVIMQFASHEKAKLSWNQQGHLEGQQEAKSRLASLLRLSLRWYSGVAILVLLVVLPIGLVFFTHYSTPDLRIAWQLPWLWIVLVTSGSLAISPFLALLEGCGLVAQIAVIQVAQSILGSVLFWAALLCHWGLFTAPITNTTVLVITAGWLWSYKRAFFRDLLSMPPGNAAIRWNQEVWPLQWRVGLSWLSGFLVTQIYTIVLFASHGPVAAGQLGLSLSVMSAIAAVALAWLTTKSAFFGTWIARKDYARLDHVFFPSLWQSWVLVTVLSAALWGGGAWLHMVHAPISARILPPLPLGLLALSTVFNHVVFAEAIYLRAHKQEPFLPASLVMASLVVISSLLLAKPFGATGMMLGNAVICLLNVGITGRIFLQKRREWHTPAPLAI